MHQITNGRLNRDRHALTPTVAPVARAIRLALSISVTLLALGGSASAIAQNTCVASAPATEICEGLFTATLPGTAFTAVQDLTLVLGDSANGVPTSVTPGSGSMGVDASWAGKIGVTSFADITTVGATGIFVDGSTSASINNAGNLSTNVTAAYAKAMDISAVGDVTVVNSGAITAEGAGVYDVTAVSAYSSQGNASVTNNVGGTITATAQDGNAVAVSATGYGAYVNNDGAIAASSDNGLAVGVMVAGNGFSTVTNDGSISAASGTSQAIGLLASTAGYLIVENNGSITATGGGDQAIGIEAYGAAGSIVYNTGTVSANSSAGSATGVTAHKIVNSGSIEATSGDGQAIGVLATANYAIVKSTGAISATGNGVASAVGIEAYSRYGSYVTNTGTVSAITTSAAEGGTATGILAQTNDVSPGFGNATVTNSGRVTATTATTSSSIDGTATGILAKTYKGAASVISSSPGNISAAAQGYNNATGIEATSTFSGNAQVGNAGAISANADVASATGILAQAHYGSSTVTNSGDIGVFTTGMARTSAFDPNQRDYATGIVASSGAGAGGGLTSVTNSGSITAVGNRLAEGIEASARNGTVLVTTTNTSVINVTGDQFAIGIGTGRDAYDSFGEYFDNHTHDAAISNAGSINVVATYSGGPFLYHAHAFGIEAYLRYGNDVSVVNSGAVRVTAMASGADAAFSTAVGIEAANHTGDLVINNSGTVTVNTTGLAYGLMARSSQSYGDVSVENSGKVTVNSTESTAHGVNVRFDSYNGKVSIINSGDIAVTGNVVSKGIYSRYLHRSRYVGNGDLVVSNSGSVSAVTNGTGSDIATAYGVHLVSAHGDTSVTNSGSISAALSADPTGPDAMGAAVGLDATDFHDAYSGDGAISITNSGSIAASVTSNGRINGFLELIPVSAAGIIAIPSYGSAVVINSGVVSATAQTDATAVAGSLVTNGIRTINNAYYPGDSISHGDITVSNSATGSVTSSSLSSFGDVTTSATGIYASLGMGSTSLVDAAHGLVIGNAGVVSANAVSAGADTLGSATATGIYAFTGSNGFLKLTNTGTVSALATSFGVANATAITAGANVAAVTLGAGSVVAAIATGSSGSATGLSVTGTGITASNAGVIKATFVGAGGNALGVSLTSPGDVSFGNTGSIVASGASAVGVSLDGATANNLVNSGNIFALVPSAAGVAVQAGDAATTLDNSGLISGTVQTGAGDDSFTNAAAGVWNAAGTSSFGGGNNTITNAGVILFDNSTVDFTAGAPMTQRMAWAPAPTAAATNAMINTGIVYATGVNQLNLGGGTFTNDGTIDFQNGVVGDTLAVAGNFAGSGVIDADVSGLRGTADQLQIAGNVVPGTRQTVNVRVLDDPLQATTLIPLVTVAGSSAGSSFVLGALTQNRSFLQLDGTLVSSGSGAGIEIAVSGLSNFGTLAASAAPGAQNLMSSEIGTYQDRMGAIKQTLKGGLSLWARVFGDSGKVDPAHSASNFGQGGSFAFDQNNQGQELGLDFALTDQVTAGLLLSKNEANQHLTDGNYGSARIRGTTSGIYGTWVADTGLYVDASFRSMTFSSRLTAAQGQAWINGNANAFNVEAGQAFTVGNGVQLAPQFQYTWDKVDNVKSETASLAGFQSQGDTSSRARLGLMVSKSYEGGAPTTVWTPYASLSAVHEFDGANHYAINNTFDGQTSTRGTSALVEGGINVMFKKVALYGGVNWLDGGAQKSFFGGQVGVRYTW